MRVGVTGRVRVRVRVSTGPQCISSMSSRTTKKPQKPRPMLR